MEVAIIDYGAGNVGSLVNMLTRKCDCSCRVESAESGLHLNATHCILPGVGHFGFAAGQLRNQGVDVRLRSFVEEGGHLLGICLGAQLLLDSSEEGHAEGLGFIPGHVRKFQNGQLRRGERIPNMGWSDVEPTGRKLLMDGGESMRFYFVHSYHMVPRDEDDVYMTADFAGGFTAAVKRGNVTGVQFHPEKSHAFGIAFLKSWLSES